LLARFSILAVDFAAGFDFATLISLILYIESH
jgi:hypothetical protein